MDRYTCKAIDGYVDAAIWAGTTHDDDGTPLDRDFTARDIDVDALMEIIEDVREFLTMTEDVNGAEFVGRAEQVGHDFYLTRNRHGAGFWDRGLGAIGERVSDAARAYGTSELYPGDDGRLYVSH